MLVSIEKFNDYLKKDVDTVKVSLYNRRNERSGDLNTQYIKKLIYKSGLRHKEIAERMEITPTYFSLIINGKTNVSLRKLEELADILGCSVKSLL